MVVNCVTYNGEKDLWDIHYNILKDHVDHFVVVEFDKTFSGKPKKSTFPREEYRDKDIHYSFLTESVYSRYYELAKNSPNTQGAAHWITEFAQKEAIKYALEIFTCVNPYVKLQDDDIVFVGDVDEVYDSTSIETAKLMFALIPETSVKLKLRVYTYYLNNRSTEEFWGTLVSTYGHLKKNCLNHLRSSTASNNTKEVGWHFTSMAHSLRKKLTDSYTHETYATPTILDNLAYNIEHNRDFLGRSFSYELNEEQWPQYLKDNREKYKHLLAPVEEKTQL